MITYLDTSDGNRESPSLVSVDFCDRISVDMKGLISYSRSDRLANNRMP